MRPLFAALMFSLAGCAAQQQGRWVEDTMTGCMVWTEATGSRHRLTWSGDCVDGKANGPGTVVMDFWSEDDWNSQTFKGRFVDGKANGKGIIIEPGVSRTEAYLVDGRVEGPISYVGTDGTRYEGEVGYQKTGNSNHLVPAGQGIFVSPGGDRYEGEFKAGSPNGHGRWIYADGNTYEGDVLDSLPHGFGIFVGTDGARYEGQLLQGSPHGRGQMTTPDGTIFQGELFEGKMHGQGALSWTSGDRFDGRFSHSRIIGGVVLRPNGERYAVSSEGPNGSRLRFTTEDGISVVARIDGAGRATLDYCESGQLSRELCTLLLTLIKLSTEWEID